MHTATERRIAMGGHSRPGIELRRATRAAADELPTIVGYASVFYDGTPGTQFELWAGVVERIMPGAFTEAIKGDVAALRNHNADMLLGRTTAPTPTLRLIEDRIGLRYEIDPPDTATGAETVKLIERGDMQGSSFAFKIKEETWSQESIAGMTVEVRNIIKVELFDVGPVTFPAYKASTTGLGRGTPQPSRGVGRTSRDAIMARLRVVEITEAESVESSREAIRARARAVQLENDRPPARPVSRDAIRTRLRIIQLTEAA